MPSYDHAMSDQRFRSTPPREGRPDSCPAFLLLSRGFDPRPHARGDDPRVGEWAPQRSFDPRPHARGDAPRCEHGAEPVVSIHAPTRGATSAALSHGPCSAVSIHAPTRGATLPPAGAPTRGAGLPVYVKVSIHAPTRGATGDSVGSSKSRGFDPRPHARGDELFRSTPPRETDQLIPALARDIVSIHAPTRGATRPTSTNPPAPSCFDPRPHARGDKRRHADPELRYEFRSTPPREGRPPVSTSRATPIPFRSTPPREGRPERGT